MSTIGIYDSGIGGLTTLARILDSFAGNDILYLADDLNHPLGNKSENQIKTAVQSATKFLRDRCDVIVLACNTASSAADGDADIIKLLPPTDFDDHAPTLLLATEATLEALRAENIPYLKTAHTPKLASMIEEEAERTYARGQLTFDATLPYLTKILTPFKGVERVVLGCSHYPLCRSQIKATLGDVKFYDGNDRVIEALSHKVSASYVRPTKINFAFTGKPQYKKYHSLTRYLLNCH